MLFKNLFASRSFLQLQKWAGCSSLAFLSFTCLSQASHATLTANIPSANFPTIKTDQSMLTDKCHAPGEINLLCFDATSSNWYLNSHPIINDNYAVVTFKPFNGGNTSELKLTNLVLRPKNVSFPVPLQFGINFDTGIFPAENGPFQMTVSIDGNVKSVNNTPFTSQVKLFGIGSVGPSFTQVAIADATFGGLGSPPVVSPKHFKSVSIGAYNSPITSYYGNFTAVFLQPAIELLELPTSMSIVLTKSQPPNFYFVPPGSQEDADPILDITASSGDILPYDVILDASGVNLPALPFNDILVEWGYDWDPGELKLLENSNPSPTTIVNLAGGLLSTITFEGLNPGLKPHDGISDFGIFLKKVIFQGPQGNFDATNQFPAPTLNQLNLPGNQFNQVVEVQVPGPLPILGVGVAFGFARRIRFRINSI
jgi:hypothetical protein